LKRLGLLCKLRLLKSEHIEETRDHASADDDARKQSELKLLILNEREETERKGEDSEVCDVGKAVPQRDQAVAALSAECDGVNEGHI